MKDSSPLSSLANTNPAELLALALRVDKPAAVFPWQHALLEKMLRGELPSALDLPTGLGKTSVIAIWLVARLLGASVPRRLVYVVDRRAVVDQATAVAEELRAWVQDKPEYVAALGIQGRTNKRFHVLDSGTLMLSGKLWIYEKRRGGSSQPMRIKVEVVKENNDEKDNNEKDAFCSVIVTPSTKLNEPTEYSKSCGRVEAGKYWVRINKFEASSTDGDGWHNRGNGTLVTE